jgi:hypothetical protein
VYEAGWRETFQKFDAIPNAKTDANNHGPFSSDNIGRNWDYEAAYTPPRDCQGARAHQKGLLYYRQRPRQRTCEPKCPVGLSQG